MMNSGEGFSRAPIKVASFLTIAVFAILGGRLFSLQLIKGSHYRGLSERNYIVQVAIKAPRGDIVDRAGQVIAGSRQSFSICGVPRLMFHDRPEITLLSEILGADEESIVSRLRKSAMSFRPTVIARDVDFCTLSRVEELYADLPDVIVTSEAVRYYPDGVDFCHLMGYVGEVTQAEIDAGRGKYGPGDFVGKAGIEKMYESYLSGEDGKKFVKFSVTGGSSPADMIDLPAEPPRRGMRVVLSTDYDLQVLAQNLLVGVRGAIIALDVRTGGVLAMASSPSYDPSLFVTGISSDVWASIVDNDGKPLINRAIQSAYPPGSTYKIVTASAALEQNMISENTSFEPCTGGYKFGNRVFSCWKLNGHGTSNLVRAIEVSCDVYFYQLGAKLGIDPFYGCAKKWRIADETGIDMPGEVSGFVPSREYYDRTYGKGKWSRGQMLNLAIGQGEMLVTPIEMSCFVSALAGWGKYYAPTCVMRVDSDQRIFVPEKELVTLPISRSTLETIRNSMLEVVEGGEGTGRASRLPGIKVAGKTGTAQNPHGEPHSWFVCFAPYESPEIVVTVVLENGGHGGATAAPRARDLLACYFGVDEPESLAQRVVSGD